MSSFFQSELVRGDIQEMAALQEYCFRCATNLALLDKERKLEYFEALRKLIDKQKIFYTRLSLSDDPEAQEMKQGIVDSTEMFGLPKDVDMNIVFNNMNQMVDVMKKEFDKPE